LLLRILLVSTIVASLHCVWQQSMHSNGPTAAHVQSCANMHLTAASTNNSSIASTIPDTRQMQHDVSTVNKITMCNMLFHMMLRRLDLRDIRVVCNTRCIC
jgi:hypothetical protein